ncbi:MAG: PLP-dependent cysteine synthase family protein [Anaerolineae bacterium]
MIAPTMVQDYPRITTATRPRESGILRHIGHTPLLRIRVLADEIAPSVAVYAKAEWLNPGGSVKDRPALRIIQEAERSGELTRDKILLDSTSGNTGIAYALIGASKGYRITLVMPENVSQERKRIVRAYGAEVILTDPLEGSDGAILEARRLVHEYPDRYFYADQYNNDANWRAHYETTAPEIWEQTRAQITHFVAGIGTSGTLMGIGRYLRERNPDVQLIAVEPADELEVIEGLKHMETAIVPGIYDPSFPDRHVPVSANAAYQTVRRLAREEGLFVGFSSGAALHAALRVAREIDEGVVVTLFPDGGGKYLSLNLWE